MSGLEVAAAIFSILGGAASAYRLAVELRKRYQNSKKGKTASKEGENSKNVEDRLKRIEKQLRVSEARLTKLPRASSTHGNHAALQSNMSIQHVLTILQQILTVPAEDAFLSPDRFNLRELEQHTDRWDREADLISRNVCPNAIRYRQNLCRFNDVAVSRVPGSEWACKLCGVSVSAASMPISRSLAYEGQVHVTANGSFKAHTTEGTTWSCIWKGQSEECAELFRGRKALLQHMQKVHMKNEVSAKKLVVDGPADSREHSVAKCGYGILHPSKSLEVAGDAFVVNYGDS